MQRALTSKRRAIPPAPSMFQRHSRDPSHQVQLSRPHISERCCEFGEAAIRKSVEVPRTGDLLVRAVNEVVDADVILCQSKRDTGVAPWKLAKTWHAGLYYEAAAGAKVPGGVFETGHLFVLRRKVHNRIEDQVHKGELALHECHGHVAFDGRNIARFGFRPQYIEHVCRHAR